MDLTSANIEALKKGRIDFLIGQEPEYQGFYAMKTLHGIFDLQKSGCKGKLCPAGYLNP